MTANFRHRRGVFRWAMVAGYSVVAPLRYGSIDVHVGGVSVRLDRDDAQRFLAEFSRRYGV